MQPILTLPSSNNFQNISHTKHVFSNSKLENIFNEAKTYFSKTTNYQILNKIVLKLNEWESKLDDRLPLFPFQIAYDHMIKEINEQFSSKDTEWNKFNKRLDDLGHGKWYSELANFLVKLPLKVARNILRILGNIIKVALLVPAEIFMHPLKAPIKLLKLLTGLIHALIQPETWTKIGAGVLGTNLSAATITGNPINLLGVGIGVALSLSGLSVGTIKTVLLVDKDKSFSAAKAYAAKQALSFTEDLLTSYCLGMLLAAIQKMVRSCQRIKHDRKHDRHVKSVKKENSQALAEVNKINQNRIIESQNQYTEIQKNEFLKTHHLPEAEIYTHDGLQFSVRWHVERGTSGNIPLTDLPDGKLVIENLQTGVENIRTDFWVKGYFKTSYYDSYVYDSASNSYYWVQEPYVDYVPGYWDYVMTKKPIYEKFCGFDVTAKGWTSPELMPAPMPIPLPVKPPMPPVFNISSTCIKATALGPIVNDSLNESS